MKLDTKEQNETKKALTRAEIIQRMKESRARIVASGERLLTWDEVMCEVAANRGRDEEAE